MHVYRTVCSTVSHRIVLCFHNHGDIERRVRLACDKSRVLLIFYSMCHYQYHTSMNLQQQRYCRGAAAWHSAPNVFRVHNLLKSVIASFSEAKLSCHYLVSATLLPLLTKLSDLKYSSGSLLSTVDTPDFWDRSIISILARSSSSFLCNSSSFLCKYHHDTIYPLLKWLV